jgi:hypothetical protein
MSLLKKFAMCSVEKISKSYVKNHLVAKWPYTHEMRVITRCAGEDYEIQLDHVNKKYSFDKDNLTLQGKTPTGILRLMGHFNVIHASYSASNWSNLWITTDEGKSWVNGKDLYHNYILNHKIHKNTRA